MLINTAPYDCLMYIFILILNIAFIVNVFMLSIEEKMNLLRIWIDTFIIKCVSLFVTK